MDKKNIYALITRFFEYSFSRETQLKFQDWFLRPDAREIKEEVLADLWSKEKTVAHERTLQGLQEMNRRIAREGIPVRKKMYYRFSRIAAVLLLPLLGVWITWQIMHREQNRLIDASTWVECFVPEGEKRQIFLPDGSEVWLNAGSLLLYTQEFCGKTRNLFLQGEGTFYVAKDPEKPFIVKTHYMNIEALGTVFNINSYNEQLTTVTLEEGSIRVDLNGKTANHRILRPHEQIIYDHRSGEILRQEVDAELITRWQEGYLIFMDASFEEMMRTLERRFDVTIQYDDRKYKGGNYTIKYLPSEDLPQILKVLETMIPGISWEIGDHIITIK